MSSETSTDTASFRPWHLFTLVGLLAATVGVVVVRPGEQAELVLLVAAIGAGAGVGFGIYRTLWPLVVVEFRDRTEMIGGRARAALEREKTLVLRAIKELEFDRAMGKVSDQDFREMGGRLRSRALTVMRQLDVDTLAYRDLIEQELAERLQADSNDSGSESVTSVRQTCGRCRASNENDAKFCKSCGSSLG